MQSDINAASSTWITIGSFDGVHRGHQKILGNLHAGKEVNRVLPIAVSFFPHPAVFLRKINGRFYISTLEEKNSLLKHYGADEVITFSFDHDFSRLTPREFVDLLRSKVEFSKMLIGYDFRLGADRSGGQAALKELGQELGFSVDVIDPVLYDSDPISSSKIRDTLLQGDLHAANKMLGYAFFVSGIVVHGDGRGKHIGLPTANVSPDAMKLIPAPGVYAALTEIDNKHHPSVVNVGHRPTFYSPGAEQTIETHILDFSDEIYERNIRIHFVERLRPEEKFEGVDALMAQIKYDIINAEEILSDATEPPHLPA